MELYATFLGRLDGISASQYLAALKQFAFQLEKCVSETSSGRGLFKQNEKIFVWLHSGSDCIEISDYH